MVWGRESSTSSPPPDQDRVSTCPNIQTGGYLDSRAPFLVCGSWFVALTLHNRDPHNRGSGPQARAWAHNIKGTLALIHRHGRAR